MNTRQIKELFNQLKGLSLIRISGGEPFLRDDLVEIVKHFQKDIKPHILHITTNGTLGDRIIDLVKECGRSGLFLAVSLDSLGEKHDKIRGSSGAFTKTFNTLERLLSIKGKYRFTLEVNHTLSDYNLDDVDDIYNVIKYMDVNINFFLARNFHPGNPGPMEPGSKDCEIYPPLLGTIDRGKLEGLMDKILLERFSYRRFSEKLVRQYYLEGVKNRLIYGRKYPDSRCVSLYDHLRLMPDGDVVICRSDLTVVGNAINDGFCNVWFSEKANELRKSVNGCKGCWFSCESIPNGIYTGDVFNFHLSRIYRKIFAHPVKQFNRPL